MISLGAWETSPCLRQTPHLHRRRSLRARGDTAGPCCDRAIRIAGHGGSASVRPWSRCSAQIAHAVRGFETLRSRRREGSLPVALIPLRDDFDADLARAGEVFSGVSDLPATAPSGSSAPNSRLISRTPSAACHRRPSGTANSFSSATSSSGPLAARGQAFHEEVPGSHSVLRSRRCRAWERSVGYSKLCQSYLALRDNEKAISLCRETPSVSGATIGRLPAICPPAAQQEVRFGPRQGGPPRHRKHRSRR